MEACCGRTRSRAERFSQVIADRQQRLATGRPDHNRRTGPGAARPILQRIRRFFSV